MSILSGGATGLLGMALQRTFDGLFGWLKAKQEFANLQEQNKQALAMKEADARIMAQEWAGRTQVAQAEAAGKEAVSANEAFAQSLLKEPERYSKTETLPNNWWGWTLQGLLVLLDVIRGLIRPALTVYLCWVTTSIWFEVRHLANLEDLSADQTMAILMLVIETILYLTTTCVTWWFGTRNKQEPPTVRRQEQGSVQPSK